MGREIRMVPPNWDHPKVILPNGREGYQPMFDDRFEDAAKEWKEGLAKWEAGERPIEARETDEYWEYEGEPPIREYFRPWKDDEATWFQVWETVSQGTPVSPPFETKVELIEYLVENGDYLDQSGRRRGRTNCDPWSRETAEGFVNSGTALSLVADSNGVRSGVEACGESPKPTAMTRT